MTERLALTYVEIDVDYCALTYSAAPCAAVLGTTGAAKCFNTIATCQDRENFSNAPVTLRFALDTGHNPDEIEAIPSLISVAITAGRISLGEDLGQRTSVKLSFKDHKHSDTGAGFDKYLGDRDYDPYRRGTFWGKFRTRQPYLQGRSLRVIRGFVGDALADMETRHYVIESFDGPGPDGVYSITAKDILKLLDDDRAQAPALSKGFLSADITNTATSLALLPAGVGNTDYPASGKVAIGGKEIVSFTRDALVGNDANTKLLCQFEGLDAATTMTDASASARTGTAVGNAQLDTAKVLFRTSSLLLDGTGDYVTFPDSPDWQFSGDFTIDGWVWFNALSATAAVFSHSTDANNQYRLIATTAGVLTFEVKAASVVTVTMSSAAASVTTGRFYHLAVVRHGNVWTIYRDGTVVATVTDSDVIPNFTSTFRIGADGGAVNFLNGWVGNSFRVSNVARWTAAFTRPAAPYDTSADKLTLTARALNGTEADNHSSSDRVQVCLEYAGADPADIIADLMMSYGNIDPAFVPLEAWQHETATYNRRLYSTVIAEPTAVRKLIAEMIVQAGLAIWWNEIGQKVRLQVLRAISTDAAIYDEGIVLEDSLSIKEQPDKRVSQIWTYFGQRNPLEGQEDASNYRSVEVTVDADAEANYGVSAVQTIYSRWIPFGGRAVATRLNNIQLGRYVSAPRAVAFGLLRTPTEAVALAGGYQLGAWPLQDATGAAVLLPIQIVRDGGEADRHAIEAEEMNFISFDSDDLTHRTITIDADFNDLNLKVQHDLLYPVAVSGDTVTCVISPGVVLGASVVSLAALTVGAFATGVIVNIVNRGRIEGCGGKGGNGATGKGDLDATPGEDGGIAFKTAIPISLDNAGGQIAGGGGGGGGSGCNGTYNDHRGGGGGGGAGRLQGAAGSGLGGEDGQPGSLDAGGTGGQAYTSDSGWVGPSYQNRFRGGTGGAPGLPGEAGAVYTPRPHFAPGDGGLAGAAIDGLSHITITAAGTLLGPQIN